MKNSLQMLEEIQIESPCPVAWESMSGNDTVRHCLQCRQDVFDLSALTAEEGARLLQEANHNVCVRIYRRTDGRIITRDCGPILTLRRLRRAVYRMAVGAASIFGFAFAVSGCTDRPGVLRDTGWTAENCIQGKVAAPSTIHEQDAGQEPQVKDN